MAKQLAYILIILSAACSSQKVAQKSPALKINADDSTEYELLVFDSGFESWYAMKNSPALSRNKEYYHNWNIQYVQEWNYKVMASRHSELYGDRIDYHFSEDYPYEIEHKLFYYFQYAEQVLKIPILKNSPRGV